MPQTLTATTPEAPRSLRAVIMDAGGNIRWLEVNSLYQAIFYEAYCDVVGKSIPFESVWKRSAR